MKTVFDEFNRRVTVDNENKKLYTYDGKRGTVTYNAEIIEDGKHTGFYTNYTERGPLPAVTDRLKVWNSAIYLAYVLATADDDAERETRAVWSHLVQLAAAEPLRFFTKMGDLRKRCQVTTRDILAIRDALRA